MYFIDNLSRMTWLYFSRNKSKFFEKFQEFKSLVENQTNKNIKVMRNDNIGELYGKSFIQFYRQHGITQ